jgi:eukaryotic-like serine/threonine-protein kinase
MDLKKFWKETFGGFVLKNILIALAVVLAFAWGTLIYVDYVTHHGETVTIPDLRGSYVEEAEILLSKDGLVPVVIDSVYVPGRKLGTIIDQIPGPNSTVKRNRPVYLIINSRQVRQVSLPELNDVSFRQADAMLQSLGLTVASVESAPSDYKDLVIGVKYAGRSVTAGTRIPEGSALVLIVGNGMGNVKVEVPFLKGMNLEDATQAASAESFVIGTVNYDVPPSGNEAEYIIYRQRPAAGTTAPSGSRIDLYFSKDKSRLNETFEEDDTTVQKEEQFF